ncbi:UbiX family flavin prenyltransferase [Paracoccus spongiarum]|uniref:Flavin prenyltransferase UbiX n=1 Tax=Paracoccus spongiarum TaxID=3064387 RepID=A0ABT9J8L6_9RHOB|nr:UbiX family flavin prenyltransferase [Paracoccus sp. 2205BS29-5]MDP5306163.1 UbiX family flavin prenyltransferase [Paracoccus sp. 2205BS29-5]
MNRPRPVPQDRPRIVVGISGASGAVYGKRMLEILREMEVETHLVISNAARITIASETDFTPADLERIATVTHSNKDIGASCASGSFRTVGMIVAPCSVKTLSEIATGMTSSLLARAADVTLKERRRLVLMLRETPLHLGHIRSMAAVTEMGGIVYPPVPAFYARPATIQDMVDHSVGRVLDLFDLNSGLSHRWQGLQAQAD